MPSKSKLSKKYVATLLYIVAVALIAIGFVSLLFVPIVPVSWALIVIGIVLLPLVSYVKRSKN